MNVKKRAGVLIASLVLSLAAIILLLALPPARSAAEAPSAPSAACPYTIGEWEGRLAVFLAGQSRPDQVFEVAIASLPASEQERLRAGIPVADDATLQRLLEDYTS